ncbi:MAG TPA: hypothetical protein VGQ90_09275 [Stellaceae bacterium]|jgi:hypothetical protein|nr:hypothetical protein [Stellaceae bacterium]
MKIQHTLLAAAWLSLALAGCGTIANLPPPIPPSTAEVGSSTGADGRFIAFVGPRRQHAEPFLGVPGTNFYALRSWLDTKTGERAHQLYVEDSYSGTERNWEAARDKDGNKLRFIPISKNEIICENGCSYAEEFAAELPEALLRGSSQGLAVSFTARSGATQTILEPGDLVQKQLGAVDAARTTLPVAAAAPPPR